jgi:hypothetical protein
MVAGEAMRRAERHPEKAQDVAFTPVGQIVGAMRQPRSSRDLVLELVEDYLDAVERLKALEPGER